MSLIQIINRVLKELDLKLVCESEAQARLFSLRDLRLKGFTASSILDVGAAQGNWTGECLRVYPEARYLLIEPLEENRIFLTALQDEFSNVQFIISAAGDKSGSACLRVQDDLDGSSFFKDADPRFHGKVREVPVVSIDDLIQDGRLSIPELVKIDVQGFELKVLEGALRILGLSEVIILEVSLFPFLEGSPLFHDVVSYMYKHGYVLYDILTIGRRPLDNALAQLDAVFVLEKSHLRQSNLWFGDNLRS